MILWKTAHAVKVFMEVPPPQKKNFQKPKPVHAIWTLNQEVHVLISFLRKLPSFENIPV